MWGKGAVESETLLRHRVRVGLGLGVGQGKSCGQVYNA